MSRSQSRLFFHCSAPRPRPRLGPRFWTPNEKTGRPGFETFHLPGFRHLRVFVCLWNSLSLDSDPRVPPVPSFSLSVSLCSHCPFDSSPVACAGGGESKSQTIATKAWATPPVPARSFFQPRACRETDCRQISASKTRT